MDRGATFRPRSRTKELALSLALIFVVACCAFYLLPIELTSILSCTILSLFGTLVLCLYHRSLAERYIRITPVGVIVYRGRKQLSIMWTQIAKIRESWVGYGKQRHRRFYLVTHSNNVIELLRDREYDNVDIIVQQISIYKKERGVLL